MLAWIKPGIEVMQDNAWKHMRCPVTSIEKTSATTPIESSYPVPSANGVTLVVEPRCWANNMTAVIHPGYPFNGSGLPRLDGVSWVENVFELLGAPGSSGQFYVDSSYVYYVPRAGEDMSTATAELALAESLVELRGTPAHVAPLNDDDPAIMYSPGWQKLTNRAVGDLRDDAHGTQSATDAMSYTFVGTGIDVLGETSTDSGEVDVTVTQAGRPIDAKTISTLGTARFAQQAIYSIAKLPKDTYTITIKKHAADASWLAIDALVTTSEPLTTVHDIVFSGLTFAYAAWSVPSKSGYVDNQAGVLWDPASGAPARVPGAVTVHRGERLDFSRNTFHHLGGAGLELADGTRNTTVVGNRFDDISAGGILVGEVDDYWLSDALPSGPARMTSAISVANNVVTNTGLEFHDTVGIWVGNARSTDVLHNLIAHTSYTGLSMGWGWGWVAPCDKQLASNMTACRRGTNYNGGNRIVANRIYDVMRTLVDGGAIYTLGGQAVVGGVTPTLTRNVVSNAAPCYHMIYHDEGSTFWRTDENVIYNTGAHWLGIWMPTSHDIAAGGMGPNYTDNPEAFLDAGTSNSIMQPVILPFGTWPAAAQTIYDEAGPEPAYAGLVSSSRLVNDGDGALRYSSDAQHPHWQASPIRGLGDVNDDIHYATASGAAVRLDFTGTGVAVLGEKNSDQGLVEITLDGASKGMVDTTATSRSAGQVLYEVHGLPAGAHTVTVTKRSGQYATIDAFRLD